MNKASAQQLLLLSRVAWGRRRRSVCMCVCVCVPCWSKAASSTWGHRYGAVLHCHQWPAPMPLIRLLWCVPFTYTRHYNPVAVNNMADMCALCSSSGFFFFLGDKFCPIFFHHKFIGENFGCIFLIKFYFYFYFIFLGIFSNFLISQNWGDKKGCRN